MLKSSPNSLCLIFTSSIKRLKSLMWSSQWFLFKCFQGTGLLLTEDDTMYEGEMNGYTLNGKVR